MSEQSFILTIIGMIVAIPIAIGVGADMFKRWLNVREKQLDREADLAGGRGAAQAAQIERLEERVRVLERIATDKGAALAAEIDGLPALSARPLKPLNPHNS